MSALAYTRTGSGEPLVLLHGLGSWRGAWDPVIPALAERFDVIAVDLPGFGESAPVAAPGGETNPAALATAVAGLLDDLGVTAPHLAGNSLGGWVALELASLRQPASVTLLSPAGLWHRRIPLYEKISLRFSRWICQHADGLLYLVVGNPVGRLAILGQTHGRPARMTPSRARLTIRAIATCPGFDAVARATSRVPYAAGEPIGAPVTVAFGSRDLCCCGAGHGTLINFPLMSGSARCPSCGHIPMADNPAAVATLIFEGAGLANEPGSPAIPAASQPSRA